MSKYLDPKADVVFKKIFAEHLHLLKSFLNAVLPLPKDGLIDTLEYLPSEQAPPIPIFKQSIVDVRCTDQAGRVFIVEMQIQWTNPEIREAAELAEESAYSEAELAAYDKYWDAVSTERTLMHGSYESGRQEGRQEGREEGLQEGEAIGIEKIALRLMEAGELSIESIVNMTGLTKQALLALQKKNGK